jgi:hypothetical protein
VIATAPKAERVFGNTQEEKRRVSLSNLDQQKDSMFCVSKEHAIFLCHPLKGCTHIRSTRRKSLGTIDETKLPIK